MHNNQRDGFMRQTINRGKSAHDPNRTHGGCPFQAGGDMSGIRAYAEKVEGQKIRERSQSFIDFYTQAALFWESQAPHEQDHIVEALNFELGKCTFPGVRERMLMQLSQVRRELAERVAEGLGMDVPQDVEGHLNEAIPAHGDPARYQSKPAAENLRPSPALSMANHEQSDITSRRVAILVAPGVDGEAVKRIQKLVQDKGGKPVVIGTNHSGVKTVQGDQLSADDAYLTAASVLFDAVYVPGGKDAIETMKGIGDAVVFINEAYRHCKPIGASAEGVDFLGNTALSAHGVLDPSNTQVQEEKGVILSDKAPDDAFDRRFIDAIRKHRYWVRTERKQVPA